MGYRNQWLYVYCQQSVVVRSRDSRGVLKCELALPANASKIGVKTYSLPLAVQHFKAQKKNKRHTRKIVHIAPRREAHQTRMETRYRDQFSSFLFGSICYLRIRKTFSNVQLPPLLFHDKSVWSMHSRRATRLLYLLAVSLAL